jgi:tRNA-dihydrouridine synthase 2
MLCIISAHTSRRTDRPQRLLSLHYGAGLVWGPEIVDKAIIGAERIVDRESSALTNRFLISPWSPLVAVTGVISYTKKGGDGKPIFTCHPIEKPFRESTMTVKLSSS